MAKCQIVGGNKINRFLLFILFKKKGKTRDLKKKRKKNGKLDSEGSKSLLAQKNSVRGEGEAMTNNCSLQ